jgi:hypothetical protein
MCSDWLRFPFFLCSGGVWGGGVVRVGNEREVVWRGGFLVRSNSCLWAGGVSCRFWICWSTSMVCTFLWFVRRLRLTAESESCVPV